MEKSLLEKGRATAIDGEQRHSGSSRAAGDEKSRTRVFCLVFVKKKELVKSKDWSDERHSATGPLTFYNLQILII